MALKVFKLWFKCESTVDIGITYMYVRDDLYGRDAVKVCEAMYEFIAEPN